MRDAFHLRRAGGDPGPAGKVLLAWRELAARPTRQWRSSLVAAAEVLGVAHDEALQEALEAAEACAASRPAGAVRRGASFRPGQRALTSGAGRPSLRGRGGEGEALAAWLADAVLAERLNWPFALPLLAAQLRSRRSGVPQCAISPTAPRTTRVAVRLRPSGGAGLRSLGGTWPTRAKTVSGGPANCAPRGQGRRCGRCSTRTCSAPRRQSAGISERGARRLFDRLVALGAVRELTGRATFRLYGL